MVAITSVVAAYFCTFLTLSTFTVTTKGVRIVDEELVAGLFRIGAIKRRPKDMAWPEI